MPGRMRYMASAIGEDYRLTVITLLAEPPLARELQEFSLSPELVGTVSRCGADLVSIPTAAAWCGEQCESNLWLGGWPFFRVAKAPTS